MTNDTYSPREADLELANARMYRAQEIDDLVRSTSLTKGEAATLVDQGGPTCSLCGERVPQAEVQVHVEAHLAA